MLNYETFKAKTGWQDTDQIHQFTIPEWNTIDKFKKILEAGFETDNFETHRRQSEDDTPNTKGHVLHIEIKIRNKELLDYIIGFKMMWNEIYLHYLRQGLEIMINKKNYSIIIKPVGLNKDE